MLPSGTGGLAVSMLPSGTSGLAVSMLPSGTQVRGFEPDLNYRIFRGEKIRSMHFFGGEVKQSVQCRRFAAL
jgi:hypothetical protein